MSPRLDFFSAIFIKPEASPPPLARLRQDNCLNGKVAGKDLVENI